MKPNLKKFSKYPLQSKQKILSLNKLCFKSTTQQQKKTLQFVQNP